MLNENNIYPFFRAIEETDGTSVTVAGKKQIMIGSNNYLGLTHHPEVKEAAKEAIDKYGTGCTGSRFLNGNLEIHEELEEKLAKYTGHEKALIFSTGMQANLGALFSICGPRSLMICDMENHASIIDATRLALGSTIKFKHNDMESLEEVLKVNRDKYKRMVIVFDGVFSMTGKIFNLPGAVELAEKYGAMIYVDDAHGLGVLGPNGQGTMAHFGLSDRVHFNMGTFSKSFASIGGFVSGPEHAINYIKHTARSFMFSASMPPAAVATVSKCIDLVMREDSTIHKNLWENVDFMNKGFAEIGFYTYGSSTPIIPIYVGDDLKAMKATMFLEQKGIFCTPVVPPATPQGEALIRTSYMATHNKKELSLVLEAFAEAKKKFDIPSVHLDH
ncbi:MAG: 8-amino-7-oxononanoate synthase [Epsilonproteobacteria bacterium]|nr:MAG: 8-amino-7-oxononanoate synthase [Campylobacterota bacterium]